MRLAVFFFTSLIICATTLSAADLRSEQANLRELQSRISKIQKQIRKDSSARDKNLATLEDLDKDIAAQRAEIQGFAKQISEAEKEIAAVNTKKEKALANLTVEQKQLAALIQLAHRQQGASSLKWLLDMQDPAELARTMTYYRYLMQDQKTNMQTVSDEVLQFVSVLEEVQRAKEKVTELQDDEQAKLEKLEVKRAERNGLIKELEKNISTQQQEVAKLNAEESALLKVISELELALADFPKDKQASFRSLRGKLTWPLKGKIQNVYGNYRLPKQGLRWRGLQIKAERNTEIRAIAYGRVVYADWLPGMGLLTIIDHGDGYLSLYGNCEMLFKKVGTWVDAGEVIALVGDSGGRNEVGLYLELRKGKTPFSPQRWFKTRSP